MSSVRHAYPYDIFISYRQKDNKGYHWVSEFTQALKSEIEATFKEEISIYFAENPIDGLNEAYDVDQSLQEKTHCLIFIPIISQTYCDPNCFAWQKELLPFIEYTKTDEIGLDIKLRSGDVTKRILPVQIHEIDKKDEALFEKTIGGIMRPIPFVHRSTGVNRPLNAQDDLLREPGKLLYRDQVNKVANTVKEIIESIQIPPSIDDRNSDKIPIDKGLMGNNLKAKRKPSTKLVTILAAIIIIGFIAGIFYFQQDKIPQQQVKSIAILPFKNLSGNTENQFFADGLVEDMLSRLSRIKELKVISRTSSEMYRDKGIKSIPQIGNELGATYIVEGSVQREAGKARIYIQLIDATTDAHIWTQSFDRNIEDVFGIQSEIAIHIAAELDALLTTQETANIEKNRTSNLKAFELYQLGRFHWNKRTGDGYRTSIDYFEQAINEDPNYGLAYAGLADTYNLMTLQRHINKKEGRDKTIELANKALQLDDGLAEAHNVLASIYTWIDRNWSAAEKEYLRAIELNPSYATAHHYYSEQLIITGRPEAALLEISKAVELDPLSFVIRYVDLDNNFHLGNFSKALLALQKCRELSPDHPWLEWWDFDVHWHLGNGEIALQEYKLYVNRNLKYYENYVPAMADSAYSVSGLNGLLQLDLKYTSSPYFRATLYGYLGENDKAMDLLEEVFATGDISLRFVYDYSFKDLHGTPRFNALLKEMNIPTN